MDLSTLRFKKIVLDRAHAAHRIERFDAIAKAVAVRARASKDATVGRPPSRGLTQARIDGLRQRTARVRDRA